jgi:hypothetical protein
LWYSQYAITITLPFITPKLYLNFLFLVQFLPSFIFYSFDYTVKFRGVCNWLPVLYWDTRLQPSRLHQYYFCIPCIPCTPRTLYTLYTSYLVYLVHLVPCIPRTLHTVKMSYRLGLLSCIYTTRFHSFTIKSLMQFFTL